MKFISILLLVSSVNAMCDDLEFTFFTDSDCTEENKDATTNEEFKTFIDEILVDPGKNDPNLSMCFEKTNPSDDSIKNNFKFVCNPE